jgi:hypothetical protein
MSQDQSEGGKWSGGAASWQPYNVIALATMGARLSCTSFEKLSRASCVLMHASDFEISAFSRATPLPDLFNVSLGSDICNIIHHRVAKGTVRNEGCEDRSDALLRN